QRGGRTVERVRRQDEQIRALTGFEAAGDGFDARGARSAERVGLERGGDRDCLLGRRDVAVTARARDRGRDAGKRSVRAAREIGRKRRGRGGARGGGGGGRAQRPVRPGVERRGG